MLLGRVHGAIVITALALLLTSFESSAQSTSNKYQTWENPDQPTSQGSSDPRVQELLDELTALVDEADRARAADPRFLEDLRDLIRGYDWPWRVEILNEDFSDGRVASSPKWNIVTGDFRAEHGIGLRSVIQAQSKAQKQSSGNQDDLAAQLLNQLLKQATQNQDSQTQTAPQSALIHVATPISNAFAVDTAISAKQANGHYEIDIYQREPRAAGYRLAYSPGARPALELLRVGSRGTAVIDAFHDPIVLDDDTPHTLQWTRDDQGEMVVSFDGTEVIRATDRSFRDSFDGPAFSNHGGDFSVRHVKVAGMP